MQNILKIEGYELLSQKVYRALKTEIVKGFLEPGTKLFEDKIATQMKISRTPVREAIRKLSAEGLIKITPNQTIIVTEISLEDIEEVLQIRKLSEGFAARIAAKLINNDQIKELEGILKNMKAYTQQNDVIAFSEMDAEFHSLIFDVCGNKRLAKISRNLNDIIHYYRVRTLIVSNKLQYFLNEHLEIADAIKTGDSEKADRLSQEHTESVLKIFKRVELNKSER